MSTWIKSIIVVLVLTLGSFSSGYAAEKLNINTATAAQMESVKGIGPKLAGAIEKYRKENHGFKSIDELKDVKGIGVKKFAKIKDAFILSGTKSTKP